MDNKNVRGINFFDPTDNALLHALQDPRVNIAGIRRADLRSCLPTWPQYCRATPTE